jgi:hypothetical protein
MSRPLEDLRIISLEQYGAGPFATVQLADLGAEVIKIEDPAFGGDVGRYVPPYARSSIATRRASASTLRTRPVVRSSSVWFATPMLSFPTCEATSPRSCGFAMRT